MVATGPFRWQDVWLLAPRRVMPDRVVQPDGSVVDPTRTQASQQVDEVGVSAQPNNTYGRGTHLWVYGDSGAIFPGVNSTKGKEWHNLLAARLGCEGAPTTLAIGGSDALGVILHLINGTTAGTGLPNAISGSKWDSTRRGIVFLHTGLNDAAGRTDISSTKTAATEVVATDADHQSGMVGAFRACLAFLSSASRVEVENATLAPAPNWTVNTDTKFSNGSARYSQAAGDTATFANVPFPASGPLAGKVHLIAHALDINTWNPAVVEIRVDGVLVKTVPQQTMRMRKQKITTSSISYTPIAIEIDASPGNHTVEVRNAGTGTAPFLSIDCITVPSTTPPPILVPKEWTPQAYGVAGAANIPTLMANYEILFGLYQQVIAEFPNATWFKYNVPPGSATFLGSDGLHPNDRGMRQMANDAYNAIQAFLSKYEPDNLYNTTGTTVDPPSIGWGTGSWTTPSAQNVSVGGDVVMYFAGGTVTAITVDGQVTGITSGPVFVPKGHKVSVTYTVAPTFSYFDLSGFGRT